MSIDTFLDKNVTLQRKAGSTGNPVEPWANVKTNLRCCIYPINANDAIAFQSTYFQTNVTHKMICHTSEDVKIDDKVVYGSEEYLIKKVNNWTEFYEIYLSEVT
jgi:hypothetical protein